MRISCHGHAQRLGGDPITVFLQLLHRHVGILLKVKSAMFDGILDPEMPSLRAQWSHQLVTGLAGRQKIVIRRGQKEEEPMLDLAREFGGRVGRFEGRGLQSVELTLDVDASFLPQFPGRAGLGGLEQLPLGIASICLGCRSTHGQYRTSVRRCEILKDPNKRIERNN